MKIKTFIPIIFLLIFLASCAVMDSRETAEEYLDDIEITARVEVALAKNSKLKAYAIKVETFKGEVQLSGFVDSYQQAVRAEDMVRKIKGIKSVYNDLIVRSTKKHKKSSSKESIKEYFDDASITAKINIAISKGTDIKFSDVKVETVKGEVRLS